MNNATFNYEHYFNIIEVEKMASAISRMANRWGDQFVVIEMTMKTSFTNKLTNPRIASLFQFDNNAYRFVAFTSLN